jgi:hypothetical protein
VANKLAVTSSTDNLCNVFVFKIYWVALRRKIATVSSEKYGFEPAFYYLVRPG